MPSTCPYCAPSAVRPCFTPAPDGLPYRCTRPQGHDGLHVACGVEHHDRYSWHPSRDDIDPGLLRLASVQAAAIQQAISRLHHYATAPDVEPSLTGTPNAREVAEEVLTILDPHGSD